MTLHDELQLITDMLVEGNDPLGRTEGRHELLQRCYKLLELTPEELESLVGTTANMLAFAVKVSDAAADNLGDDTARVVARRFWETADTIASLGGLGGMQRPQ